MTLLLLLGTLCIGVPSSSQSSKISFSNFAYNKRDAMDIEIKSSGLYVVDVDPATWTPSSDPVNITEGLVNFREDFLFPTEHDWSPDGKKFVFVHLDPWNPTDIYTIGSDGSTPSELVRQERVIGIDHRTGDEIRATGGLYSSPVWSPDGMQISFSCSGNLYIMNSDGSGMYDTGIDAGYYDWTVDNQFVHWGGKWIVDFDGGNTRQISEKSGLQVRVSPDGKKIAICEYTDPDLEIWLVNIDGSDLRYLTDGYSPAWSPDSKMLAFLRRKEDSRFREDIIYIIDVETGREELFFEHPDYAVWRHISWSPWLDGATSITPATWGEVKASIDLGEAGLGD